MASIVKGKNIPLLFLFLIIVLLSGLYLTGNLPLSAAGGFIQMEYDTKTGATNPIFYRELNFETGTEKNFWLTTQKEFTSGGKTFKIESSEVLEINIKTGAQKCIYTSSDYDLSKLEGQYLNFHVAKLANYWGIKTYEIGAPKRELKTTISINKWNEQLSKRTVVASETKDIMKLETFKWDVNDIDGSGFVEFKGLGALQGVRDCPQTTMLIYYFDGKYYIGEKDKVLRALDQYFGCKIAQITSPLLNCYMQENALKNPYVPSAFSQSFISYQPTASGLTGTLSSNVIAKMELRADANFFDMLIVEKKLYPSPTIVECSFGNLQEGVQGTGSARVRNTGDTGVVYMYTKTDESKLGISYSQHQTIKSGGEYIWAFALYPKAKADAIEIELKACDETGKACSKCTKTISIEEKPSLFDEFFGDKEENKCGNGKCESSIGETYITCPSDCKQPQEQKECPNYSYRVENGECICIEGYKWTADGKCEQMNILDYLQLWFKQGADTIGLGITVSGVCCLSTLLISGVLIIYFITRKKVVRKIIR